MCSRKVSDNNCYINYVSLQKKEEDFGGGGLQSGLQLVKQLQEALKGASWQHIYAHTGFFYLTSFLLFFLSLFKSLLCLQISAHSIRPLPGICGTVCFSFVLLFSLYHAPVTQQFIYLLGSIRYLSIYLWYYHNMQLHL